jgi:hypothetical protein
VTGELSTSENLMNEAKTSAAKKARKAVEPCALSRAGILAFEVTRAIFTLGDGDEPHPSGRCPLSALG